MGGRVTTPEATGRHRERRKSTETEHGRRLLCRVALPLDEDRKVQTDSPVAPSVTAVRTDWRLRISPYDRAPKPGRTEEGEPQSEAGRARGGTPKEHFSNWSHRLSPRDNPLAIRLTAHS